MADAPDRPPAQPPQASRLPLGSGPLVTPSGPPASQDDAPPMSVNPYSVDPGRSQSFSGRMLDLDMDAELQLIVEAAATSTGFPIAFISLVLKRTQIFRAHVGLPPELAMTRSADRSAFLCQYVVERDAPFFVRDAALDPELPREVVDRYGMRAYVGLPLRMQGRVLGTLSVLDREPRDVRPEQVEKLEKLAALASRRLAELSGKTPAPGVLISHAAEPAFAEIRNLLSSIVANAAYGRMVVTELEPLVTQLAAAAKGELPESQMDGLLEAVPHAVESHRELTIAFAELDGVAKKLIDTVGGLEKTVAARSSYANSIGEAIDAATLAAHHFTKLIGGVRWAPMAAPVNQRPAPAWTGLIVSIALQELAARLGPSTQEGIDGRVEVHGAALSIVLGSPGLSEAECKEVVGDLSFLLNSVSLLDVSAEGSAIRLRL